PPAPAARKGKTRGAPKRRGERLPTPKELSQSSRGWRKVYVILHGRKVLRQIKSMTCLWWHVAKDHPIKVVIVKNPSAGKGRDDYLFSTDATMSEQAIIQAYPGRWPVEEAI